MKAEKLIGDLETQYVGSQHEVPPDVIAKLRQGDKLYIDTETTGLNPWQGAQVALVQMYQPETKTICLARVWDDEPPAEWVCDLFEPNRTMVGHNLAGFDISMLHHWGVPWERAKYFDTLIGETIVATVARSAVSKSLRASVRRRTGDIVNKDIEHGGWRNRVLTDEQEMYAKTDVLVLPELMEEQMRRAEETEQLNTVKVEHEVMPVYVKMNLNGFPIHMPSLQLYLDDMRERTEKAEVILRDRLGNINYNSPVQLKKGLHNLGIDLDSTAKATLIDQIQFDPESDTAKLLEAILLWRAPRKRQDMYGSAEWQAEHIQPDGRVHPRFWQAGAVTFRSSCSGPNLQQVPRDGRWVFGHLPGYKIIGCDYSQIEVRIAAELADDEALIDMLQHDDVHTAIAATVYKIPADQVTKAQRKMAKAMVFTLLFGGGYEVLYNYARRSGSSITREEAREAFQSFFGAFQGLWHMRQKAYSLAKNRRTNTIVLPHGGRRVMVGSSNSPTNLLNTPVQGSAGVGKKYAMIEMARRGLDKYISIEVHDELVATVPDNEAEEYAHELEECMLVGMRQVLHKCPAKAELKRLPDGTLPDYWMQ